MWIMIVCLGYTIANILANIGEKGVEFVDYFMFILHIVIINYKHCIQWWRPRDMGALSDTQLPHRQYKMWTEITSWSDKFYKRLFFFLLRECCSMLLYGISFSNWLFCPNIDIKLHNSPKCGKKINFCLVFKIQNFNNKIYFTWFTACPRYQGFVYTSIK